MSTRTRFKIIVYIILAIIVSSGLVWWRLYTSAQSRDYERLAEMKVLQGELSDYFLRFNTYRVPECPPNMLVNFCVGKGERRLAVANLIDPMNSGGFQYLVADLSEDNFQINFALEVGLTGLPAGNYVLTKEGISK